MRPLEPSVEHRRPAFNKGRWKNQGSADTPLMRLKVSSVAGALQPVRMNENNDFSPCPAVMGAGHAWTASFFYASHKLREHRESQSFTEPLTRMHTPQEVRFPLQCVRES